MGQETPAQSVAERDEEKSAGQADEPGNHHPEEFDTLTGGTPPDDDSLEAILLQAGAGALRNESRDEIDGGRPAESSRNEADPQAPRILEAKVALAHPTDEANASSLLEGVEQALSLQAMEYRDRARGRLPGMPVAPGSTPNMAASFDLRGSSGPSGAEFEDPDEAKTTLTPAVIPVVEDTVTDNGEFGTDISFDSAFTDFPSEDVEHRTAQSRASEPTPDHLRAPNRATATATADSKPTKAPSFSGGTGTPAIQPLLGPPPGTTARVPTPMTTPAGGITISSSGRVRLPSPASGLPVPTVPTPSVGRTTLPPGTASPVASTVSRAPNDLLATSPSTPIALARESTRRSAAAVATPSSGGRSDSGRVVVWNSARPTEPVAFKSQASWLAALTVPIKVATLNLAGLIVLTFMGGLLVGMLVWRDQGRSEPPISASPLAGNPRPTPAPARAPEQAQAQAAPSPGNSIGTAASAEPVVAPLPPAPAPANPEPTGAAPQPAAQAPVAVQARAPNSDPGQAPVARATAATVATVDKAIAESRPSRSTSTGVAAAATGTGARAPAASTGSPPAANATASKPTGKVKGKVKAPWRDPFAD